MPDVEKITWGMLLDDAVQALEAAGLSEARRAAMWRLGEVLGVGPAHLVAYPEREATPEQADAFAAMLARRLQREPLQYILGYTDFYGLRLRLTSVGITGTSFIEADFLDPVRFPTMEIAWRPKHLYIPSAPSAIATITSAAERIFARLENTEIEKLVKDIDVLVVNLNGAVEQTNLAKLQGELESMLDEARTMLAGVNRLVASSAYDLEATLENSRMAAENLRDLTDTLKSYPSLIVLGDPPNPPAVSAQ